MSSLPSSTPSKLPLRTIPGSYGIPFFGAVRDRYDYFYTQGQDEFFEARIREYNSTVFRTNMPPGPFMASSSKVVAVLDSLSFPILFDTSKVEKRDVLDGTYMPTTSFFGGNRPLAFLDPSESNHYILKSFFLSFLASSRNKFIPMLRSTLSELFQTLDAQMSQKNEALFNDLSDNMSFNFMFKLFTDINPSDTSLGSKGPGYINNWLLLQLAPLATLGIKFLPGWVEDLLLHTFPLPSFISKSGYEKIYNTFYQSASRVLDEAEKAGIERDEACHNLVFIVGFNAFGGAKIMYPALMKWVASAGERLHVRLAKEIRTVVKDEGGVTFAGLDKMTLTKSVVYEALRIEPPVPFQYGKAKEDIVVSSHDSSFLIKKGEMIFGYQTFATKDPKVFENADEFIGDRFVGEEGEKLLKYIYWSNARETDNPTADTKQCPGKDLVVLMSRIMLVEFFLRYDTFTVESKKLPFGPSVTIKSLKKAT